MRLPKFKVSFDFEKKVKEKPIKIKKSHSVSMRTARTMFWGFLILLFMYFSYVLIQSNATVVKNRALRGNIATLSKQLDEASAGTTNYNPTVGQYLTDFLTEYYTVNSDNKVARENNLHDYFAKNLMYSKLSDSSDVTMALKKTKLNGIFTVDGVKTGQFDLVVNENGQDKEFTVNVPYVQRNEKLTVVGYPYLAEQLDSIGQVGNARYAKAKKPLSDAGTVKRVRKFTEQFVTKYLSSSEKEMSLVMADPKGLSGMAELDTLNDTDINVSGSEERPVVDVKYSVRPKDSDIVQEQTLHLELKKQDNTYFVSKLVQA